MMPSGRPCFSGFHVRAAVDRLEDAAVGAAPGAVLPRALALLPQRRVDDVRIGGIDVDVLAAGVLVDEQHAIERLAAVGRAEDPALLIRAVGMAEGGDEQPVRVRRIDGDLRNLLRVAQAQVGPGLSGVSGFVDAVAHRQVRPRQPFPAADVDDVGIGQRDRHPADRSGRLVVEDRLPRAARVGGLPDAAVHHADVERVRLARNAGGRLGPSGAIRPDVPPPHLGEETRVHLRRLLRGYGDDERTGQGERQRSEGHEAAWKHAGHSNYSQRNTFADSAVHDDADDGQRRDVAEVRRPRLALPDALQQRHGVGQRQHARHAPAAPAAAPRPARTVPTGRASDTG